MNFIKKEINTSSLIASKQTQIILDDSFNIPETRGDLISVISKNAYIILEKACPEKGKLRVAGKMKFIILYQTQVTEGLDSYEGEMPFDEFISIDNINDFSKVDCKCVIEDVAAAAINSRKLEIRCLLKFDVSLYDMNISNAAVSLENGQGVECRQKKLSYTAVPILKRDVFKIKEDVEIPQNKPNIKSILWYNITLRNMEYRAVDNAINVRGEVEIFVIYEGMEEHQPIQYVYLIRNISQNVDCNGVKDDMIVDVSCCLGKGSVMIHEDEDCEDRVIAVDYNVDMSIKLFEDMECDIICDVYSPNTQLDPIRENISCEKLLIRNQMKNKFSHKKRLKADMKILQICYVYGDVWLDDYSVEENGIAINGNIKCYLLYIANNEDAMNCMELDIPFESNMEIEKINKDCDIKISTSLDQIVASMLNSEEMEIKGQINIDVCIMEKQSIDIIRDMTVSEIDYVKKANMQGIVGYVVKKDDSIWSIARKYYSTAESIKKVNSLESDEIKEGDRLMIIKK